MTEKKDKRISEVRAWTYVLIGGLLEIVWASGFKYEAIPSIVVLISLIVSFDLIIRATKVLPVGTTYAVFAGMGTLGTTIMEIVMSGGVSVLRIVLILTLLACIIGLKLSSKGGEA
ncbi:paired small multidrug resistance pump [Seinonella peptonophila]|uniref:Paired small multidrug resistance pump n=1 Tax=Seinonella peptonophila TaxID=112248 RepID=A0A1M5B047_9BACL|nr:SMR family transporter [Seinonella peptonophila]SHF35931.1 paired small multidrug resistance pump [Seinonella peptonophila]